MLPMHRLSLESQSTISPHTMSNSRNSFDDTTSNVTENDGNQHLHHQNVRLINFSSETSFATHNNSHNYSNNLENFSAANLDRFKRRLSSLARRKSTSVGSVEELPNIKQLAKNGSGFYRKVCQHFQLIYEKTRLQKIGPLLLLLAYTFLGGLVIYHIEGPVEASLIRSKQEFLDVKKGQLLREVWDVKERKLSKTEGLMRLRESVYWYTITVLYMGGNLTKIAPQSHWINKTVGNLKTFTEQMAQRCWEIRLEKGGIEKARRLIERSLSDFERHVGVSTIVKPVWTYSNALFLAITIYTTIGYGSVFPHTTAGRVATILYAICGIPLYLIILHKLGRVFLALLHKFYNFCLWIGYHLRCITELHKYHQTSKISFQTGSSNESYNVPVSLAIGVTFGWMFACAGVFCVFFETSWDYFTSFYFFFISLTTIGFGDVTPSETEDMFTFFGLIIIGLSLVSMCINVVQLKLEQLFEDMMMALIEETGDVTPINLQAPVGFVQLFHFLKKKRRAKNPSSVYLPLIAQKKRKALLEEYQRKSNLRTVSTQTCPIIDSDSSTQTEYYSANTSPMDNEFLSPTLMTSSYVTNPSTTGSYVSQYDKHYPSQRQSRSTLSEFRKSLRQRLMSMDEEGVVGVENPYPAGIYDRRWSELPHTVTPGGRRQPYIPLQKYRHAHQRFIGGRKTQSFAALQHNTLHQHHLGSRLSRTFITYPQIHAGVPRLVRISAGFHQSWTFAVDPNAKHQLPVMCLKRLSKEPVRDDFKSLIHEIGARLNDCRTMVKPASVNPSSIVNNNFGKQHRPSWADTPL